MTDPDRPLTNGEIFAALIEDLFIANTTTALTLGATTDEGDNQ